MRILVLGGTKFVGRHFVEAALAHGHDVTLFHRGKTNPGLFPGLDERIGDRDGDLAALGDDTWDACVDTCGYVPRIVRASAAALAPRVVTYTFVSTLSVFREFTAHNQDENAPLGVIDDPTVEVINAETYGPLKVLCEQAVQDEFPGGALILRPGVIVGPFDPTDRFTYWVRRGAQEGDILAPGRPERLVQFIDARDFADFMLARIEDGTTGTYNTVGPQPPCSMRALLETCQKVGGGGGSLVWASEKFLEEAEVKPWSEMPHYLPGSDDTFDCRRAVALGLRFRSVETTVRDTLAWDRTRSWDAPMAAGVSREREAQILTKWRSEARG